MILLQVKELDSKKPRVPTTMPTPPNTRKTPVRDRISSARDRLAGGALSAGDGQVRDRSAALIDRHRKSTPGISFWRMLGPIRYNHMVPKRPLFGSFFSLFLDLAGFNCYGVRRV